LAVNRHAAGETGPPEASASRFRTVQDRVHRPRWPFAALRGDAAARSRRTPARLRKIGDAPEARFALLRVGQGTRRIVALMGPRTAHPTSPSRDREGTVREETTPSRSRLGGAAHGASSTPEWPWRGGQGDDGPG